MCRTLTSRLTFCRDPKLPREHLGYFIMPARSVSDIAALLCRYLPSYALAGVAAYYAPIAYLGQVLSNNESFTASKVFPYAEFFMALLFPHS